MNARRLEMARKMRRRARKTFILKFSRFSPRRGEVEAGGAEVEIRARVEPGDGLVLLPETGR